jgi:hypothetical protein
MAVVGFAFLMLVVMPFLIYVSMAWVMRAARLKRAAAVVPFDAAGNALRNVSDTGVQT